MSTVKEALKLAVVPIFGIRISFFILWTLGLSDLGRELESYLGRDVSGSG